MFFTCILFGRTIPHDVLILYSSGSQSSIAITSAERGLYGDRQDSMSGRSDATWSPVFSYIGSSLSAPDDSLSTSMSIADDDGFVSDNTNNCVKYTH